MKPINVSQFGILLGALLSACAGTQGASPSNADGGSVANAGSQSTMGGRNSSAGSGNQTSAGGTGSGAGSAGAPQTGGFSSQGGAALGGTSNVSGGTSNVNGGTANQGGTGVGGSVAALGGSSGKGQVVTGGVANGGAPASGGSRTSGGTSTGGSVASGGASTGGSVASGGAAATGGSSGAGSTPLGATPAMGWNNFNYFVNAFTHTTFEQAADAMVSSGLKAVGYQYINIDDTWSMAARDANGNLVPDPKKFPNGIKALADYVHARGLKLGIYADRGVMTCSKYPGSYGYEARDAALFAAWGVDFVKVDNCYPNVGTTASADRTQMGGTVDGTVPSARYQTAQQADFSTWANAIKNSGRPMLFSICAWWFYTWEPTLGHMFRTTKDIKSNWTSFLATLDGNGGDTSRYTDANFPAPGIARYAGPGHFNDPDMLEVGNPGMTDTEQRAQFSLWAIMAAPLILGNNLTQMSAATLATISNPEVIAVDQDPLGVQGTPISQSTTLEVWSKPLSGTKAYAVALFNRTASAAPITVTWSSLGISGAASVRDLWAKQDLGTLATQYTVSVPSHGVVLLKVIGQ